MSILRRRRTRNFTIVENEVFSDESLSLEAMGLLAWLRSRPDNWSLSVDHLRNRFKVGRNKMHDLVRELVEAGWILRERTRDPESKAFNGIEYIVLDEPKPPTPHPQNQDVALIKNGTDPEQERNAEPCPDLPEVEKPEVANQDDLIRTERKQIPPNPLAGGVAGGSSIDLEEIPSKTAAARFERFQAAWPADPTINWERVESGFYRMPADDQDNACKIAGRYVEYCRREGRKLKAPQNWLREKGWSGFLDVERKASEATERGRTMVWVQEGTRAWDAWKAHFTAQGKPMKSPTQVKAEKGLGWFFPSLFPPD